MSKELIISANRHETRVAVVEDDQVVEIFHQRENEYSLAGSIHKGRVTRVLPGMQSAFVDIGLDRDAFLYVSDFFEDNDEYDKIVTSVEDKVFKQQSGAALAPVAVERPEAIVEAESAAEAPVEEAVAPPPAPPTAGPHAPERRDERGNRDRDNDQRRGRGRRRGRGGQRGGGRGLPDSKFYSPRADGEARPEHRPESRESFRAEATEAPVRSAEAPVASGRASQADDFLVLPGEKLSKYRHDSAASAPHIMEEPETVEPPEDEPLAIEPEPDGVAETAAETETEIIVEPEPVAKLEAELPVGREVEPEAEAEFEVPAELAPAELAEAVEEAADEALAEEDEEAEAAEAIAENTEAIEENGELPAEEFGEAGEPLAESLELSTPADAGEESETAPPADEGPEPARIPTSLTATLREQGGRYPHRVSRRSRRRGRGQEGRGPDGRDTRNQAPAAEPAQRVPQQEVRTVEGRTERPERPERADRPERAERAERSERPASISELLREGQEIIVQIAKEPLGQKGARITSHIALPGRFLVYMPTVDHIGVSRKIPSDDERARLKRVLQTHRTGIPGGYIVRTAGDGRTEEELRADMMFLYNLWLDMRQKAERRPAPLLIHHDLNVVERILRDQLTSSFKNIWVDNEELYEAVLSFVQRFQPTLVSRVKMYTRSTSIFDEFSVTAELEKALRPKVWLKSGGYIVINQTEALVAIDINTGKYVGKSNRLEDTIVKTNIDAIKEIVRQIRLRDLGGIIVVDFIDMDERKNRQKVMQALEEAMRADRAPYKILQFNDFGLVAITRKRVKQSLERTLCTPCPYCEGAGYVKSPQTVVGEILQEAHKIARAVEGKDVLLRVNPEVARLLKSNQNTFLQEIEEILGGRTVMVKGDPLLHQEKFDLA
jgi:ribonuclease G